MQTLKLSKLRARQIADPKIKLKYPKKFSIKTEDSSLTLTKSHLPWTLHPLPPPLSTSKTVKLEVEKSMPWALHPLPPPMKTKNYAEYYWQDPNKKQKYRQKYQKPYHIANNNYKYHHTPKMSSDFKPSNFKPSGYKYAEHKPSNFNSVDHKPSDFNPPEYKPSEFNHPEYKPSEFNPPDFKHSDFKPSDYKPATDYKPVNTDFKPDNYRHVDYKHVDYKQMDYNKPSDYKPEYPKDNSDEDHEYDDHHHNDGYHESYGHDDHDGHDDHSADVGDLPSPQSPSSQSPPSSEYVSHITIEPSIQIASFSETELQGDGTNRETVSRDNEKQRCQCTVNGHRHKRSADGDNGRSDANNGTATVPPTEDAIAVRPTKDSTAEPSSRNSYANVGHATDVQIVKSYDISDQQQPLQQQLSESMPTIGYVQHVRNLDAAGTSGGGGGGGGGGSKTTERQQIKNDAPAAFKDDSDRFKVDFGRQVTTWNEPVKSTAATDEARFSQSRFIGGGSGDSGGFDDGSNGYGNRPSRKPDRSRGYHLTKSKVENSGGGVAFSVQTPFSVSSFSSNVRLPGTTTEERQSRFRFGQLGSTASPSPLTLFGGSESSSSEPLDFEQFGLQSATALFDNDDKPTSSGRSTGHFSRGFSDRPSSSSAGRFASSHFADTFSNNNNNNRPADFSGRIASQFPRDFGDDRSRSNPFQYNAAKQGQSLSDRFNGRLRGRGGGGGRGSSDDSSLEYFQPIVIDFDKSRDDKASFVSFNNGGSDKSRYFGKSDSTGFSKFKKNQNLDPLRLPGRLHESNENLSRKMLFHPSTFDID